jgi:hypothetical protein
MSVFTVFFCGTGSNSWDTQNPNYPNGELISTLASHHAGSEFVDWIVVDGPGSGNLQEDDKWVTPGNYGKPRGTATGAGWEENVAHAVAVIKGNYEWSRTQLTKAEYEALVKSGIELADPEKVGPFYWRTYDYPDRKITPQELQAQKAKIMRKGALPSVVNVIGWSRGGVTCHMLANAMFKDDDLQHIPVNIFAVDPVPGTGNFQAHRTSIPANVVNYVGVYARDERSKGFAPTLPGFSPENKPVIMSFPGRHATLVGNASLDGNSGNQQLFAPGLLVRHLAEKYLTSWGTPLNKRLNLATSDMARLYAEMVDDAAKYEAQRLVSYIPGGLKDEISGERSVGKGADWTSTKFSDAMKTEYYLHHKDVAA